MRRAPLLLLPLLAACGQAAEAPVAETQRVSLDESAEREAMAEDSPDTSEAGWTVEEDGQAISFGNGEAEPFLTLDCQLDTAEPELRIIRHATALPGQEALFPIIGNGINARFLADATFAEDRWQWEARLLASDARLDVFGGTRDLIATLPGRGTLEIAGDRLPGEFVEWCRAGGTPPELAESEATEVSLAAKHE